jgi:hypothetical protein
MRGRYPVGLEIIDKLSGSDESKQRLKIILQTLCGETRVVEACELLELGETRFQQLRDLAMQSALSGIEPRPAGRPSRATSAADEQIRLLQRRVQELEQALHEAQVREEIALVLPQRRCAAADQPTLGKKTRSPRAKIRKPR